MFRLLCAIAIFIASPALAFDAAKTIDEYYEVRHECRIGENAERTLSAEEGEQACERLQLLGKELTEHGFCWNDDQLIWAECGVK